MNILNCVALNAVANTGTKTSDPIRAEFITAMSAQAVFSDAGAGGTFKLQASLDVLASPTSWNDVPSTSQTVTSGATTLIPYTLCCYQWVRVSWTQSAAAGTVTVRFKALEAS